MQQSETVSHLATMSCYIQAIQADLRLLASSYSPAEKEDACITEKLDMDMAGFMRCALALYTLAEAKTSRYSFCEEQAMKQCLEAAKVVVNVELASLPQPYLLTNRINMLQDHIYLLTRTLQVILENQSAFVDAEPMQKRVKIG